jgi:hypothetical protein
VNDSSNAGLSWLNNQSWQEVTREERYFCAELYGAVRDDVGRFIAFLRDEYGPIIGARLNWEVGYEICFYRDWARAVGRHRNAPARSLHTPLSLKRTFDLALFSDTQIVLFEIKANRSFIMDQQKELETDRTRVEECTGVADVQTAGIISSKYTPRRSTLEPFTLQPLITWNDVAGVYRNKAALFRRADMIYRN